MFLNLAKIYIWFYQKFQIQFNKALDSLLSLILFSSHIPISIKILQWQYTLTYICRALQNNLDSETTKTSEMDNMNQSLGSDYKAVYDIFFSF